MGGIPKNEKRRGSREHGSLEHGSKPGPKPHVLQKLFRLKYQEGIRDKNMLAQKLEISLNSLPTYETRLKRKLVKAIKQISEERLRLVCPECLEARIIQDQGETVCTNCGLVIGPSSMVHTLPMDETYALENPLVFNKGLGTKTSRVSVTTVLAKNRYSKDKIEAVTRLIQSFRGGERTALEASEEICSVFLRGGAEEIADSISSSKEPAKELARRIVNKFDAIPIHQIMTLHEVHEPVLMRKMKEHGERFRKECADQISRFCNTDVFSVDYGETLQKVGNVAVLDPHVQHSPKDLAAGCLVQTVRRINSSAKVRLSHPPNPDVLRYVHLVMSPFWKEKSQKQWNAESR